MRLAAMTWVGNALCSAVVHAHGPSGARDPDFGSYDERAECVQLLLEAGIDKVRSKNGQTYLHVASFTGNPKAVQLLIKHGADLTAIDTHVPGLHRTALGVAIKSPFLDAWRCIEPLDQADGMPPLGGVCIKHATPLRAAAQLAH